MPTLLQIHAAQRRAALEAERQELLRKVLGTLPHLLPVGTTVWVFGSLLAPGAWRADSDIDLALEVEPSGTTPAQIQGELEIVTGRAVDILLLAETRLAAKIRATGQRWTL